MRSPACTALTTVRWSAMTRSLPWRAMSHALSPRRASCTPLGARTGSATPQARAPSSAVAVSGQGQDDDRRRSGLRQLSYDVGEQHRSRHPPVHGGSRARRGGHRGLCLLLARLRGRPGARRERDHCPAGAGHDRRPRVRLQHGHPVRGTAPGTGTSPGPLAARHGHHGHPHSEHGPGLVTRSRWSGGRGLASGQPCRFVCTPGLAHPHVRAARTRAISRARLRRYGVLRCGAFRPSRSH